MSASRSASARRSAARPTTSPASAAAPAVIAEADAVTPALSVGPGVIRETVRLAALEVPGVLRVGRGGPRWRDVLGGSPIRIRIRDGRVDVTLRARRAAAPAAGPAHGAGPRGGRRRGRAPARHGARRRSPSWSMASEPDGPAREARAVRGRPRPQPACGPAAGARGRVRGGVRPADGRRDPRAPPGDGGGRGRHRRWPARSSETWSATAIRSTPGSPPRPPNTRSFRSPGWTAHCCVAA